MKYFIISLAVLALTVSMFSLTFAGKEKTGASISSSVTPAEELRSMRASEALMKGPNKSVRPRTSSLSTGTSNPIPVRDASGAAAGLSGLYHIPGDFPSISAAVAVLNFNGVAGAVTFQLDSASYTELSPVTFGNFPGAGTFTATIQPRAATAVTVNFTPGASEGKGFAFNGAKGITIDGVNAGGASLTLQYAGGTFPSGDAYAATIYVSGGSDGITVKNSTINGNINAAWASQTDGRGAVFIYGNTAQPVNQNITIDANTIINATFGIKALTSAASTSGATMNHVWYTNNHVGGAYGGNVLQGALTEYVGDFHYDNNIIDGIDVVDYYWNFGETEYDHLWNFGANFLFDFGQYSAGHIYASNGTSTVAYNWVKDVHNLNDPEGGFLVYGLVVRLTGSVLIHHNRIQGIVNNDNAGSIFGFRVQSNRVWQNSVRLTGAMTHANIVSSCLNGDNNSQNNAFSNEITGATLGNATGILNTAATSDGNAIYAASGRYVSGFTSVNAYLAAAPTKDNHSQFGPISFDADLHITTGPSAAENMGRPALLLANDIDGTPVDTTIAGTRDAGADDFANTGSPRLADAYPATPLPPSTGGPSGVPQVPKAVVKNNSNTATGAFNVTLSSTSGPSVYTDTKSVSIGANDAATVTFANFTPLTGTYTFTVTTALVGDADAVNDVSPVRTGIYVSPGAIDTNKTYTFNASAEGWTPSVDWVRSSSIAKLGGVYGGSGFSWVTNRPNLISTYTEGGYANTQGYAATYPGANLLTSPFVSLAGMTGDSVWVSFYHSIDLEPDWDRCWLEFTTNGITWTKLGALNDPKGVNWYSETVYENSVLDPVNFDDITSNSRYGLNVNTADWASWTSNGDQPADVPTGPNGYVYVQLKIDPTTYPSIIHAGAVAFRYVAFSDAAGAFQGWAFDNFRIGNTAPTLLPANISGKVYTDADGSGSDNGMAPGAGLQFGGGRQINDAGVAGVQLDLKYFGVHFAYDTSDGSGNYDFNVALPGSYTISASTLLALSEPTTVTQNINYTGDGVNITGRNFGLYDGAISGTKYNDLNNNGVNDDGAGFAGFTIEAHRDSCNGALYRSTVTGAGGTYSIPMPPGTWYLREVPIAGFRQTSPAGNCQSAVISGPSGGGSSHVSGKDFGNFQLNVLRVQLFIDQNGNGVKEGTDINPLTGSFYEVYEFTKNGAHVSWDTLGRNSVTEAIHTGLDTGAYASNQVVGTPAGWVRTLGSNNMTFTVTTSAATPALVRLDFQYYTVSGVKFNDLNGNGVNDGEPGLAGWTINLTGNGAGSTVTDSAGNYSFANVGSGSHILSEVGQAGWDPTVPAGGTTNFTNNSGVNKVQAFGNFDKVCVSGTKYRDRNNNGTRDGGEEGLAGWKINYGNLSAVTDSNGNYSFCDLGAGADTLSEVGQLGYTPSEPSAGYYVVVRTSGSDATGLNFGNFNASDSATYRTWTVAELAGAGELKAHKKPKPGKPILAGPNTANLLIDLLKIKAKILKVGVTGSLNAGGKEKSYLQPKGQSDAYATFNKKGVVHTGPARGFDMDVKGKLMLKRWKSMPATKKNDLAVPELLALRLALLASANANAPAGLGDLLINRTGNPWNGMSINQFADAADGYMTNWEGVGFATFDSIRALAADINAAFSTGSTTDTATDGGGGGWFALKMRWRGTVAIINVPFLKQGKASPRPPVETEERYQLPSVFALNQNYPNPFNPTTYLSFDLPEPAVVTLKVYNMLGQEVATLLNNESFDAGTEEVEFDASSLSSGVYLYRITASTVDDDGNILTNNVFTTVKKMLLVK